MINFRNRSNPRSAALRVGLYSTASFMALAFGGEALAQQQLPSGNSAASAKDGWPFVVAQQQPTPVPDVSVTAPKTRPASTPQRRRARTSSPSQTANPAPGATTPTPAPTASALNSDGSTPPSGGLYVPNQSFGPFGPVKAQDNPFSTNSIPQEIIRDQQATTLTEAMRNDPSYGSYIPANAAGYSNFYIRGFAADNPTNNRIDGLPVTTQSGILLQDYERIDIYKGLPGLLYGFTAAPGGMVNYVSKLPLDKPLTEVSTSFVSNSQALGAADVSRRFGSNNEFGIRVNAAGGDGDTSISGTSNANYMAALALDWRPAPDSKIWFNSVYSSNAYYGLQPSISLGAFAPPPAPNSAQFRGDSVSQHIGTTRGFEGGVETEIAPWLSVRGTVGNFLGTRDVRGSGGSLTDNSGNFSLAIDPHNKWSLSDTSAELVLNAHFSAGIFTSKTDFGVTANREIVSEYNLQPFQVLGASNLYNPVSFGDPGQPIIPNGAYNSTQNYSNFLLRETLDIGRYLTIMGGVARSQINFYDNQALSDGYDQATITPLAAIVIKPTSQLSLYASYIQGLEPGTQAAQTFGAAPVLNAFATLAPFVATQYEVGTKYQFNDGLQATLAAFRIKQPSAVYQPTDAAGTSYTYVNNGEQVNSGIELNVSGRLTNDLKIFGGATFLDPKITQSQGGATDGKVAVGIPAFQSSLFAEYAIGSVPGLSALAGVFYKSSVYVDSDNTRSVPGFATLDLGFKYETKIADHPLTARFYVQNVTGKDYWVACTCGPVMWLGDPRSFRLAVSMRF
jgi:iron complex outermembrane recepter protein